MRTARFIVSLDSPPALGGSLQLDRDESHHLSRVLRLSTGDSLEIYDRRTHRSFRCTVKELGAKENGSIATVEVAEEIIHSAPARVEVIVAAVSNSASDEIIEKSTEIGATGINFFSAERSQEKLQGKKTEQRLERFERVALAALKQSGGMRLPNIRCHADLETVLRCLHPKPTPENQGQNGLRLLLAAPGDVPQTIETPELLSKITKPYENLAGTLEEVPQSADFYVLIGPEGGWSKSELSLAVSFGYQPISLGPNTLRTETAVAAALALLIALAPSSR